MTTPTVWELVKGLCSIIVLPSESGVPTTRLWPHFSHSFREAVGYIGTAFRSQKSAPLIEKRSICYPALTPMYLPAHVSRFRCRLNDMVPKLWPVSRRSDKHGANYKCFSAFNEHISSCSAHSKAKLVFEMRNSSFSSCSLSLGQSCRTVEDPMSS